MWEVEGAEKRKRGAMFEGFALSAAAIAFGCVAFADFLNHTIKPKDQMAVAVNRSTSGPHPGIDYSATGSIISLRQPPALSPCEKKD